MGVTLGNVKIQISDLIQYRKLEMGRKKTNIQGSLYRENVIVVKTGYWGDLHRITRNTGEGGLAWVTILGRLGMGALENLCTGYGGG